MGDALLSGIGIGKRNGVGVACVCRRMTRCAANLPGNVLVVPATNNNMLIPSATPPPSSPKRRALNPTRHRWPYAGKPVVVGAAGATRKLHDGVRVSVDGERGVVHSMPQ
ncbi:MAG: hypothetical protein ACLR7U_11425 [Ruthenibacterium lactatiformans]